MWASSLGLPVNQLLCGDAKTVISSFPDDSIDLSMTSPPYWGLRDYKVDGQIGLEETPYNYIEKLVDLYREIKRVLKPSGSIYIVVGDTYFGTGYGVPQTISGKQRDLPNFTIKQKYVNNWLRPKQKLLIPDRLFIALQEDGWLLRNKIIWNKPNPMPESCDDRYSQSYEEIGFFTKSEDYFFDMKAVLKPLKKSTIVRSQSPYYKEKKSGYRIGVEGHLKLASKYKDINIESNGRTSRKGIEGKDEIPIDLGGRHPRDVWSITTRSYHNAHFAVYPEELVEECVKASSPKNGIVLDPMMGSGTTCLVAWRLGRNFIGVDIKQEYVDIANKRLNGCINQKRLL